jgi:hypothetical protein
MFILRKKETLKDTGGQNAELVTGDAFVIPHCWKCFEVLVS